MKNILTYFVLFLLAESCFAVTLLEESLNIPSATGYSSLEEPSKYYNPSIISEIKSSRASLSVEPSIYILPDLNRSHLFIGHRINDNIVIAGNINAIGNNLYNELNAAFNISANIGDAITLSGKMTYGRMDIKNYSNYNILNFHFGGLLDISENLSAGVVLTNLNRATYEGNSKSAEQTALISVGYTLNDNFAFDVSSLILIGYGSGFSVSGKYVYNDNIQIRLAYQNLPKLVEGGFQYSVNDKISMTYRINYNMNLGFVNSFAFNYAW